MTPSIQYKSSTFPIIPEGQARIKYPLIPSSPVQFSAFAFDQDLSVVASGFPPAQRNAPCLQATFGVIPFTPSGATQASTQALLTSLSQPRDTGAGILKFTGSFAVVPASWDDFQTQLVNFPAWLNYIYGTNYRDAHPVEVSVRMRYDYFVIDPGGLAAGIKDSGGAAINVVNSKGAIPILRRAMWLAKTLGGAVVPNEEVHSLVPAGGIAGIGGFYPPTLPTVEQYQAWCAIAAAFYAGSVTWDATHPPLWDGVSSSDVSSGQFRLTNSKLIDYAGNIISRVTAYALVE